MDDDDDLLIPLEKAEEALLIKKINEVNTFLLYNYFLGMGN